MASARPGRSARSGADRSGRSVAPAPRARPRSPDSGRPRGTSSARCPAPRIGPTRRSSSRGVGSRPDWYDAAVGGVVEPAAVERALRSAGAWWRTEGSNRGIVGAAAAVAWPGRRRTWELIAYRPAGASGPRAVDPSSVRDAARREPSLFLCFDPRTRRLLVAPHTPCPILYGLRSRTPEGALRARKWVTSETVDRWLLFRTNQGTGDHLRTRRMPPLPPFTPARLRGAVASPPTPLRGGHVALDLAMPAGVVPCRVFEPTKVLPGIARGLRPGDRVELWGGTGPDPVFRVEGIRVLSHGPSASIPAAPQCPTCDRRARSLGTSRGYRCPGCHRRWPPEAAVLHPRPGTVPRGTYHPTPSARRHLAPLGPEPAAA